MDTLSLTKEARIYNGEKTSSLTSGAGKTGHRYVHSCPNAGIIEGIENKTSFEIQPGKIRQNLDYIPAWNNPPWSSSLSACSWFCPLSFLFLNHYTLSAADQFCQSVSQFYQPAVISLGNFKSTKLTRKGKKQGMENGVKIVSLLESNISRPIGHGCCCLLSSAS